MPAAAFGAVSPAASGATRNLKLTHVHFMDYRGWPKEAVAWLRSGNLARSRRRCVSRLIALLHGQCHPMPNPSNITNGIEHFSDKVECQDERWGIVKAFGSQNMHDLNFFQGGVHARFSRGG
eukprot:9484748-Pyramimonas_sp.AAC.1